MLIEVHGIAKYLFYARGCSLVRGWGSAKKPGKERAAGRVTFQVQHVQLTKKILSALVERESAKLILLRRVSEVLFVA